MGRSRYLVAVSAVMLLLVCTGAASAGGSGWTIRFTFVPSRAYQGLPASVSVSVRPLATTCQIAVRYVDGSLQRGSRHRPHVVRTSLVEVGPRPVDTGGAGPGARSRASASAA